MRRALGPELPASLHDGENVISLGATATWNSPEAFLVLTDRRLIWLLDDAVSHRDLRASIAA